MEFYEKIGVTRIINASETYTKLGGSLMSETTLEAMREAAGAFVDMDCLLDQVCARAAEITGNEAAFVTTGASGGVILSAAACMVEGSMSGASEEVLLECFPDASAFEKNEFLVFDGEFLESVPYWKLLKLTGGKVVPVKPVLDGIREAVTGRTAAFVLFPSPLYERGIPTCEEAIPVLKELSVPVIVDASAQLPPPSNLSYYSRKLGADAVIFSGGKHIRGPQSTGLIVGRKNLMSLCRKLASPHERLGRGFKTGKEELAGFLAALEEFVLTPREDVFNRQQALLDIIQSYIEANVSKEISIKRQDMGRLGTYQPLLLLSLPEGKTAGECNKYTRSLQKPVDIGTYTKEFRMPENLIFLNAYNLKGEEEAYLVARAVTEYIELN